jgi:uncharacterized protein
LTWQRWISLGASLAIAGAGGVLATFMGVPASWLSGAMVAATVATFAGLDTRLPIRLVDVVFLVIGVSLGAGVTPELVAGVTSWPISLAGLALTIAACVIAVREYLVRIAGWDRDTAFFSALPGALSYVLAVASETRADIRKVAVSQSVRVFLLVAVLPSVILAVEQTPAPVITVVTASPTGIAILAVSAVIVGLLFRLAHVPAAWLTGSLAASAVLHGGGWVTGTLPEPAIIAAFVMLGALIASRFAGTSLAFLKEVILASVVAFVIATSIATALALIIASVTGESADQMIVAFAPGGLDAMTTLALAMNMDTAFVAAHQLTRFAGIALLLPFLARKALRRGRDRDST